MSEIQKVSISKLKLLENNPRKITKEKFEELCKSIDDDPDFLWKRPCLVNQRKNEMIVYAGNQRVRAAEKLGWTEIPCIIDKNLSKKLMQKRIIRDNKSSGEWDYDILANEWDYDILEEAGFTAEELTGSVVADSESTEGKKQEKKTTCPHCGYEFEQKRRKKND